MAILAFLLLLISIAKLLTVVSCKDTMEVKKMMDEYPVKSDIAAALLTADGLIGLLCSAYLLTVIL